MSTDTGESTIGGPHHVVLPFRALILGPNNLLVISMFGRLLVFRILIRSLSNDTQKNLRFQALYDIAQNVCAILWSMLVSYGCLDKHCQPKHLLWPFYFMKTCLTAAVLTHNLGADKKTIWKWVWYIIVALLDLKHDVISVASSLCLFDCHVFARILTLVILWKED